MLSMTLTALGIVKAIQEFEALLESGKNCEFTMEWIVAKEQIEYRRIIGFIGFPIGIGHGYLVQIWKKVSLLVFNNTGGLT